VPRPLDGHKLLRVVKSLRLTEREGVDADQYVSATAFPVRHGTSMSVRKSRFPGGS
jgi:hypothetical protein